MRRLLQLAFLLLAPPLAWATAPVCLNTDTLSGPVGSYVEIFGQNFGASPTVTVNGVSATVISSTTDITGMHNQIGVQVPGGASGSGNIVVTVGANTCGGSTTSVSNTLAFTVRTANVYYLGSGNDTKCPTGSGSGGSGCSAISCATIKSVGIDHTNPNTFANPWGLDLTDGPNVDDSGGSGTGAAGYGQYRTPATYIGCMSAGDVLVVESGTSWPYYDGKGWHASLTPDMGTTSTNFFTIEAYPGAAVQPSFGYGTSSGASTGYAFKAIVNNTSGYAVVSGLALSGSGTSSGGQAVQLYIHDRIVNNLVLCPTCYASTSALGDTTNGANYVFIGENYVQDAATSRTNAGASKTFHAIYMAGSHLEIAWNRISSPSYTSGNGAVCNGIQIHNDYNLGFWDVSVHDNYISDVMCSAINISAVDPSMGYVNIYNNVAAHTGLDRIAGGGGGNHSAWAHKGFGGGNGNNYTSRVNVTSYSINGTNQVLLNQSGASMGNGFSTLVPGLTTYVGFGGFSTTNAQTYLNGQWLQVPFANSQTQFVANCASSCTTASNLSDTGYYVSAGGLVITNTAITGSSGTATLTVVAYNGTNPVTANDWVTFYGLTAGACLNGKTLQVSATGLSNTQIEVPAPSGCSTVSSTSDSGVAAGGGQEHWWNNTTYDPAVILNNAGYSGETGSGALYMNYLQLENQVDFDNNVSQVPVYTQQGTYNTYVSGNGGGHGGSTGSGYNQLLGADDWWYGATNAQSIVSGFGGFTSQTVGTTPNFTSAADPSPVGALAYANYIPNSSSTMTGAGEQVGPAYVLGVSSANLTWDFLNLLRPNPPSIGALEYAAGGTSYTLTASTTGAGSGSITSCPTGSYTGGGTVNCGTSPATGSSFTGWSGTCGLTGSTTPTSFTMPSSACTVIATFALNTYTLTVSTAGSGSGSVTGCTTGATNYGAAIQCTATAGGSSVFAGWSGTLGLTGTSSPSAIVNMPASAATVIATFNNVSGGGGGGASGAVRISGGTVMN